MFYARYQSEQNARDQALQNSGFAARSAAKVLGEGVTILQGALGGLSLDPNERGIIQRHAQLGSRMLADGRSPVLILGAQIALSHHERWDGTGYPDGLAEDEIPIAGRIAAIADVFDALTSDRVYRPALPFAAAVAEMQAQSGRQFDPHLLGLFLGATGELEAIRAAHPDPSDL
ncbi:MAG: HD-GYP domain-containing protein [Solirubrobacteraceae bacterium]